jgi:putative transcriptional regulator
VIAEFQRPQAAGPSRTILNINSIVGIQSLHEYFESIRREDVCHESKYAQAPVQI